MCSRMENMILNHWDKINLDSGTILSLLRTMFDVGLSGDEVPSLGDKSGSNLEKSFQKLLAG